jgi:hypothetical protein
MKNDIRSILIRDASSILDTEKIGKSREIHNPIPGKDGGSPGAPLKDMLVSSGREYDGGLSEGQVEHLAHALYPWEAGKPVHRHKSA